MDCSSVVTPCYVCDEAALRRNLEQLSAVREAAGCKILLALKGFAMFSVFPMIRGYLDGVSASSPHEAELGRDYFGGEIHAYAPAYSAEDLEALIGLVHTINFNSLRQWRLFQERFPANTLQCGLRVNPGYSEVKTERYNPCARYSRLGVKPESLEGESLEGLCGLHFHTMCEQNSDTLERTVEVFEQRFGHLLPRMDWVNFGGGHHITRDDYDVDRLVRVVKGFRERHGVEVYLEPGEAVALNAGFLAGSVLDVVSNEMGIAILDVSATAHMPDVLEMPYRPEVIGGLPAGEGPYTYRLTGPTCLAGDVIGDYSFAEPLEIGDKVVFTDMAHYTMVKNSTFNGVQLPSIAICREADGAIDVVREFGYEDYRSRLS